MDLTVLWMLPLTLVDRLHATAESHHRVMFLEVMGRNAGWIALYSGVAGGADVVLIPEIPYHLDSVVKKILDRSERGSKFSIVVVAEGAMPKGGHEQYVESTDKLGPRRLGGAADMLSDHVFEKTGFETRTTVLGHLQRGGSPSAYDRILGTRFGAGATRLVAQEKFGWMPALENGKIYYTEIKKSIGALKNVEMDNDLLSAAQEMGISFGE